MATSTEITVRITEAETALHNLATGSRVEEITSVDGSRLRFGVTDPLKLSSYISYLRQQLSIALANEGLGGPGRRRPIYPDFGR
jgi:hypothetical protein